MNQKILGKTGYDVSAVCYGGIVSSANYSGYSSAGDGQKESDYYVSWAIEHGINYFDVAPSYGDAQQMLGNSLIPYREKIYLACKTTHRKRAGAEQDMKESLKLLHTDYFDNYQLHALSSMEELETAFSKDGVMELLIEMKDKGLTRKVGITAHNEDVAIKALELYDFDTVLFPFNWHMNMAQGMGNRLLQVAKEKNVGILCMKSMIERAWDDSQDSNAKQKYPKSWCKPIDADQDQELLLAAVKYALSLGVDAIIPPGNFDHFKFAVENIEKAVAEPLSEGERKLLEDRLKIVRDRPFF